MSNKQSSSSPRTKMAELNTSLFLTFILIPLLTIGGIAAYGFVIWFLQILNGPPGS